MEKSGEERERSDESASSLFTATKSKRSSTTDDECSSPSPLGWPILKAHLQKKSEPRSDRNTKLEKLSSKISEIDMMKERFSKLLLGEDMSGSGKGVSTSLAISNAITNLCGSVFGQLWRLEPLASDKKTMWRREMEWLLCVSDHIVELIPSWQTCPNGTKLEVMTCRPRSDIFINLPALRKLDNILIEMLDSFSETEFWYVDQGVLAPEADGSGSFRKSIQRQEEKWWLPVPRVPAGGLSEDTRKQLNHKRECGTQILKAAMAINSIALSEMEVPESYWESLPKNGKACLGDVIYRYITSDQFSSEILLDCIDLSSEHVALEIANRVEASIYVWRRRLHSKPVSNNSNRSHGKSSWEMMKELMTDGDKRELLADRAESLLLWLKQRFPGLTQTSLDTSKIQYNKDVGKSILESYSRVLESLAFNIVARIDDVLYVDELTRSSDKLTSVPTLSMVAQKRVQIPNSVQGPNTPYKTAFATPTLISPARGGGGERTPFAIINGNTNKLPRRGGAVKRVLSNYLNAGPVN